MGAGRVEEERKRDQQALMKLLAAHGSGSWLRGWRRVMDPDGMQSVDFQDYLQAAVRINFKGDPVLLFGGDGDCSTLDVGEVSAVDGDALARFMDWALEEYGGPEGMFEALNEQNEQKDGKLPRDAFLAACLERGCPSNGEEIATVFDFCDAKGARELGREDVICLHADPETRAEAIHKEKTGLILRWKHKAAQEYLDYLKSSKSVGPEKRSGKEQRRRDRVEPRAWHSSNFDQMPFVICHLAKERAANAHVREKKARDEFIQHLWKAYGNPIRAFRKELAKAPSYFVSRLTLSSYCRSHDLTMDLDDLWQIMDYDCDGCVHMEDLHMKAALALARFRTWATEKPVLGSCAALWTSAELSEAARKGGPSTSFGGKTQRIAVIARALRSLEWPGSEDETKQMLHALDYHGCGMIELSDLQWLDRWRPVEWLAVAPDPEAWEELRALLLRLFGHPLRAWRQLLDRDDSNHLTWTEFKEACRKIKFDKAATAWKSLDLECKGAVSLKAYDCESYDLLHSFKDWVDTHFGSVKNCFRQLDQDRSNSLTYNEMRRACKRLRWKGDVRLLFDCMDTDNALSGGGGLENRHRTISLAEISFLDNWKVLPPDKDTQKRQSLLHSEAQARVCRQIRHSVRRLSAVIEPPQDVRRHSAVGRLSVGRLSAVVDQSQDLIAAPNDPENDPEDDALSSVSSVTSSSHGLTEISSVGCRLPSKQFWARAASMAQVSPWMQKPLDSSISFVLSQKAEPGRGRRTPGASRPQSTPLPTRGLVDSHGSCLRPRSTPSLPCLHENGL